MRSRRLPALLLLLVLLTLAGLTGSAARSARGSAGAPAVTPSDLAGFVVLSGFRPIAVDMLWIRAEDLARERRYYELLSLYELITALDPYFEAGWVYNSFNLAFRLSELEDTPAGRWRWIREALIYAMKGMEKNPESDKIAFAIAWIYYCRVPQEDYAIRQVLEDPELNPDKKPVIELARRWAERGCETRPHIIYIDWILEFIYRDYGEHATDPAVKLDYLKKRLRIWRHVLTGKPLAAKKAAQKIKELEAKIAEIKSKN